MMASHSSDAAPLRKTRVVCISDTHNQTPKLPPGDVLIHAGDLTNQGSYSELKKTVRWLEQADFEAKIVIAGNHEITLDTPFYNEHKDHWKWPEPQDSARNRALLTDSPSITYLENSHATIYLNAPTGPRTCFKVFGSPCQPNQRRWAFRYSDAAAAEAIWSKIEDDVDIVVTHTPAEGLLDKPQVGVDFRCGCPTLLERLSHIRPRMHVCGHIHDGRGVGRVRWGQPQPGGITPIEAVEYWKDPGAGNRKLSLVDVSLKSGRPLLNTGCWTRHAVPDSLEWNQGGQPDVSAWDGCQPGKDESKSTSIEGNCCPCVWNEAGKWRRTQGGAIELRMVSDVGGGGRASNGDQAEDKGRVRNAVDEQRTESVMINAAFLGGRVNGKAKSFNKPIVVDIELPVWDMGHAE